MLNVCFGASECGMLKFALDGERVTYSHRGLELGGILPERFDAMRREWIDFYFSFCSVRERNRIWRKDCERFEDIINSAKSDGEIRVWYASSPCSKCGLYHLLYSLRDVECRIYAVEMPPDIGFRRPPYEKSWGEAEPYEARKCLKLQKELTSEQIDRYVKIWERLALENAPLRLNVNGSITSVPENYLDGEILSYAPLEGEFSLGWLVGMVLGNCIHAVSDSFIAGRIEKMIDEGLICAVRRSKKYIEYYIKTVLKRNEKTTE